MFLKSIHVKNLRCFDDVELTFLDKDGAIRQWTILLGENGTGKSTLMKALALITCGSDALNDLLVEPDDWIRHDEDYCEISAVLVTKEMDERPIHLRIELGDNRRDMILRNAEGLELLDRALEHSMRNYFVVGFGASRRLSLPEVRRQKTSSFWNARAESVATLFDPDATLNPLESWAMDLDYRFEDRTGIRTVREVLSELLPEIQFHDIDKKRGRLLFETVDGIVPLRSLSDGYQSAAAWIGELLFRVTEVFEDYQAPLQARGLLLIDEVDLHLHPKWQRQLLSFLGKRLSNFQLVVTTHSPMTAQQAGPGELFYLTREGRRVQIEQFTANPRNLLISQLLMTDAFGLESDESLELQKMKDKYRDLKAKEQLSPEEEDELGNLTKDLKERPLGGRSNLQMQQEQLELLQRIEKELQEGKS